jgi:thymidylate synthase
MNSLDKKYTDLLQDILDNGVKKEDRTGTGTLSLFGKQIIHKMSDGFPLLTTKKMPFKLIATELMWFLRGDTNIKFLVDNDCHIWDGDCFSNYLKNRDRFSNKDNVKEDVVINGMNGSSNRAYTKEEFINKIKTNDEFAKKWGDLGPVYGKQWRSWGRKTTREEKIINPGVYNIVIDQIENLIRDLKTNPDSRRLMVNAWNVGELDQMVLPPCHYGFQIYTRELSFEERYVILKSRTNEDPLKYSRLDNGDYDQHPKEMTTKWMNELNIPTRAISLMWNQRSVDTFLGLPFNIASYGLLLEIIAKEVNMVPDELIGNLGDTHLYLNHIEQAKEQIGIDLTDEERYHIWFGNNYETGMERFFDPNNLPNFDDVYYEPTPNRTRDPYALPQLSFLDEYHYMSDTELVGSIEFSEKINKFRPDFFKIENYQSHPSIKAPLSN